MTLGDRLKQLRADKQWTQPQAAEAIGIEQSYLSKLENDKSLPSADILTDILNAFSVTVGQLLEGVDPSRLDRQFLQIPVIAAHRTNNHQRHLASAKKWLSASAMACILGLTMLVGGHQGLIFANEQYSYASAGVVKPGESQLVFDNWRRSIETKFGPESATETAKAVSDRWQEIYHRLEESYVLTSDYKGEIFVLPVKGGSRTYQLLPQTSDGKAVLRRENRLLMLLGLLLTFSGIAGFVVESRLRTLRQG